MYCPVLCVYSFWEKCHLHFGVGFEQWGRFHELYSVVCLTLGNRFSVHVIFGAECKLWMTDEAFLLQKETPGTFGTGSNKMVAKVYVCACLWSQWLLLFAKSFFFFFHDLTSLFLVAVEEPRALKASPWPKWETKILCAMGEQRAVKIKLYSILPFRPMGCFPYFARELHKVSAEKSRSWTYFCWNV